jgi:hypothetical protein
LVVHHKTYARITRESLGDLEVLCRHCHDTKHPDNAVLAPDPAWREHNEGADRPWDEAQESWGAHMQEWRENIYDDEDPRVIDAEPGYEDS